MIADTNMSTSDEDDDELLGINDDPIVIKCVKSKMLNPYNTVDRVVNSTEIVTKSNKFEKDISVNSMSWIKTKCQTNLSKPTSLPNTIHKRSKKEDEDLVMYNSDCKNIQLTSKIDLTSEDHTEQKYNRKISNDEWRYHRMKEIPNVTGFIVNTHDSTNFDIDFDIPYEIHDTYQDVISNQYSYHDFEDSVFENPNLNMKITPKIGTTYRCRLRGIGINQSSNMYITKSNRICMELKLLIDRTDGWIKCTLSDIDVYRRLLVDIEIHTCNEIINLHDYLLNRMVGDKDPIFYPYHDKQYRNNF